jgi:hypothetical protein
MIRGGEPMEQAKKDRLLSLLEKELLNAIQTRDFIIDLEELKAQSLVSVLRTKLAKPQ